MMTGKTTEAPGAEGGFDALIEELGVLAKALPTEADMTEADAEAEAAAAEAAAAEEAMAAAEEAGAGEAEVQSGDFGKSFSVTMPDGSTQEVYDAGAAIEALEAGQKAQAGRAEQMAKAMTGLVGLVRGMHETVTKQAALIKSLDGEVKRLGAQPAGRRAISAAPTAPAAPRMPGNSADLMAKCSALVAEGKLNGVQASIATARINRGDSLPEDLARLFAS